MKTDTKEKNLIRLSLLALLGSLVLLISNIVVTLNAGSWMSLSILGMVTIVLAATVERHGNKMKELAQRLK